MTPRTLIPSTLIAAVLLSAVPALADKYEEVPRGRVFVPVRLFNQRRNHMDKLVRAANPRLYVYPDHAPGAKPPILVVGLPGLGGRSENFIWTLINGLKLGGQTSRLVVAAVQDMRTGGPRRQGLVNKNAANFWGMHTENILGMRHFLRRMVHQFGKVRVFILGFSSGGVTAPRLAIRMAQWARWGGYSIAGGVALGSGSPVTAKGVTTFKVPVLFVVAPHLELRDLNGPTIYNVDQRNRRHAERVFDRLIKAGADAHLRYVFSVRRHNHWHWGLVSQCRYFPPGTRVDAGQGWYPDYWTPNPETYRAVVPFIMGKEIPWDLTRGWTPTKCKH